MQWRSCKRELSPHSGTCHLSSTASTYLQKTILATLSIYYLSRLYLLLRVCETARPWVCGQSVGRAVGRSVGWSNKWCDRDRGSESERGEGSQPASQPREGSHIVFAERIKMMHACGISSAGRTAPPSPPSVHSWFLFRSCSLLSLLPRFRCLTFSFFAADEREREPHRSRRPIFSPFLHGPRPRTTRVLLHL